MSDRDEREQREDQEEAEAAGERRERRDAAGADADAEDLDHDQLAGESDGSARAARGPDAEVTRDLRGTPGRRRGEGPPRTAPLSEDPEDMGKRVLERVTEAPEPRPGTPRGLPRGS